MTNLLHKSIWSSNAVSIRTCAYRCITAKQSCISKVNDGINKPQFGGTDLLLIRVYARITETLIHLSASYQSCCHLVFLAWYQLSSTERSPAFLQQELRVYSYLRDFCSALALRIKRTGFNNLGRYQILYCGILRSGPVRPSKLIGSN